MSLLSHRYGEAIDDGSEDDQIGFYSIYRLFLDSISEKSL